VKSAAHVPAARRQTRREQNAASGRRLLEALVDLVAEKGYEATTAAEIGVRAGFSRAMVHARYGTKDALLDELMRTEYEQRIMPDVDENSTGLEHAQAFVDRLDTLADEDEPFLKAMFKLSFEAVRGQSALTPRITMWLSVLEAGVVDALQRGKEDGSVLAGVETSRAARDILINGFGIAYSWLVLPETNLHDELARWRTRIADDYATPKRTVRKNPTRSTRRPHD
jgi:AcrR family transcriptional regulator